MKKLSCFALSPLMLAMASATVVAQEAETDEPFVKVQRTTSQFEADMTPYAPAPQTQPSTGELARLATLEEKIDALQAENAALNDELNTALREGEEERLSISSENWNLEKATMLYNEAERQNKKLGMQLQKERAQWAMEKKELEAMLFDPQLTTQEQLAKLSRLEQELEAAKARIRQLEGGTP